MVFRVIQLLLFTLLTQAVIGDRILLIIDKLATKESHSLFVKSIESRGHSVAVNLIDDSSLALIKYDEFLYDHLILFAPSADEFGGSISVSEIVKFIDGGGNLLVAGAPNPGDAIRDLAKEVGFEFDADRTEVIDNVNFDQTLDKGQHTTILVPPSQLINSELITGDRTKLGPILYRGVALTAENPNPLRLILMNASSTAYSFNPKAPANEHPAAVEKSTILAGALQARNNARVVLTGSLDFFSNEFFNANVKKAGSTEKPVKSGNLELATSISKWFLKETGVLRINSVNHHVVGQIQPPSEYTIMEDVEYEIDIEELVNGKWVPFQGKDVQMEFVRIDPFIRTTLQNKNGKLTTQFKVPDVYGVYKFLVDYHRVGYTHLYDVQQVSVRPLKHTEYERFSRCAYPYYVSAFSMMAGVWLFSLVFLYHKEAPSAPAAATVTAIKTPASAKSGK